MKKRSVLLAIALLIVIAIVAYGVDSSQKSSVSGVKLGIMLPLTGDYAAAGQNMQKGMELALEKYKNDHPGSSVSVVIEDDGYDAAKGLTAYKKLTSLDKVDSILMLSTPVIDAIHADVVQAGIPVIQLGVQTAGVADDNIFQFSPAADAPIGYLAKYLNEDPDFFSKKVAVIYDNATAQLSFLEAFKRYYTHEFTPLVVNSKDNLRSYAAKVAGEGYGAVVVIESPQNGALFTQELIAVDHTMPLLAFDAQLQTGFADYERILGDASKIDGALSMWFRAGKADAFKEAFKERYGEDPGFLADFAYDMINADLATYDKDDATWVGNLKKFSDPDGVSGSISFDDKGVRIQPMTITQVKNGKLVPIE